MSKAVFVTVGITSYINSLLKLGNDLKANGIEVFFVCVDDFNEEQIRINGFPVEIINVSDSEIDSEPFKKGSWGLYNYWKYNYEEFKAFRHYILDGEKIGELLKKVKPDIFILPSEMTYSTIALYGYGIPIVQLQFFPSPNKSAAVPLPTSNLCPGKPINNIKIKIEWITYLIKAKIKSYASKLIYRGLDYHSTLKLLAQKNGFPIEQLDFNTWNGIGVKGIPELVLYPNEFDFPRKIQNNQFVVGPLIELLRKESKYDKEYNDFKNEFEKKSVRSQKKPVVYCAFGTSFDEKYFLNIINKIIGVFRDKKDWVLLMSIGKNLKICQFKNFPQNVFIYNYTPQIDALQRADLMINHGGIGSINESIMHGVPMLIISGGKMDQNGNAARVIYHKIGLTSHAKTESINDLRIKLEELLFNPIYKDNIEKMKNAFIAQNKKKLAAQCIIEHIK